MKKFPSSGYTQLVDYWVSMSKNDDSAMCSKTAINYTNEKQSRLHCTYETLTSYSTVVARRYINNRNEELIIMSNVSYSVTTGKQLRNLYYHKNIKSKDIVVLAIRNGPIDKDFIFNSVEYIAYEMAAKIKKYKRARLEYTKKFAENGFMSLKEDGEKIISFFNSIRRTNTTDSKILKNMSINDDPNIIRKKLRLYRHKWNAKKRERRACLVADDLKSENYYIINKTRVKVDMLNLSIACGLRKMNSHMQDSFAKSLNLSVQKKNKVEYYVGNFGMLNKNKADELMIKYYEEQK